MGSRIAAVTAGGLRAERRLGVLVLVALLVVLLCGIVSGGGKRRVVTAGAKWTGRIGDVLRRHDRDDVRGLRLSLRVRLRSRGRTQKRAQIADLLFELIHRNSRLHRACSVL